MVLLLLQSYIDIVPCVMSGWAHPACEYALDACMHGGETDLAGVEKDERDMRTWEDQQIAYGVKALYTVKSGCVGGSSLVCLLIGCRFIVAVGKGKRDELS